MGASYPTTGQQQSFARGGAALNNLKCFMYMFNQGGGIRYIIDTMGTNCFFPFMDLPPGLPVSTVVLIGKYFLGEGPPFSLPVSTMVLTGNKTRRVPPPS